MTVRKAKMLNSIQRPFLINITRAFRTTSTNALQVLAGVRPLSIEAEIDAIATTVLQLKKPAEFNGIVFQPDKYETKPRKFHTHPAITLDNLKCNLTQTPPNTTLIAYTDGSKIDNKVGCGMTIRTGTDTTTEWQGYLRPDNNVFQAELAAIKHSISYLQARTNVIHIITDSQSSIYAIKSPTTTSPIAHEIQNIISSSNKTFILTWTRGHSNCEGNERADILAKQAAIEQRSDLIRVPWPQSAIKLKLKQLANEAWQMEWTNGHTGRRTHSLLPKVNEERIISNCFLTQFISGHGSFPTYLCERNLSSNVCVCAEMGDPDHYILQCPLTTTYHVRHPTNPGIEFLRLLIKRRNVYENLRKLIDSLHQYGLELCSPE
ncbi:uncharacterized protein LOC118184161 [Stegodyphus dumicola]|uniref:uncharacterized protein LOC118184161 n=1 Tax=Stegodyphus dumicola TaxID=202533 RepID=UPI0015A81DE6|nr:uncharacterized protein LOC118184161 [Stegodyphus dumicola]